MRAVADRAAAEKELRAATSRCAADPARLRQAIAAAKRHGVSSALVAEAEAAQAAAKAPTAAPPPRRPSYAPMMRLVPAAGRFCPRLASRHGPITACASPCKGGERSGGEGGGGAPSEASGAQPLAVRRQARARGRRVARDACPGRRCGAQRCRHGGGPQEQGQEPAPVRAARKERRGGAGPLPGEQVALLSLPQCAGQASNPRHRSLSSRPSSVCAQPSKTATLR